jgi:hypothetical protein
MDAIQRKELLHLRIEQANDQLLEVLAEMAETLFKTYQPEVIEEKELETESDDADFYAKHLKPMTREEMTNELAESMADYEKGNYITLEESAKEAASW